MIERLIEYSARNRLLVIMVTVFAAVWGAWGLANVPLDAIPDLSDVQVIVFTEWPGRSPDLVAMPQGICNRQAETLDR